VQYQKRTEVTGQITIFIIVGLVVLMSTGLMIYLTTTEHGRRLNDELNLNINAPYGLDEFDSYVKTCIRTSAAETIKEIARSGGDLNKTYFRRFDHQDYTYRVHKTLWL